MTPARRNLVLAGLAFAVVVAVGGLAWMSSAGAAGLDGIPALASTDIARLPEADLIARMQTDLSRRSGTDWRRRPEAQRHLFAIGMAEPAVCRGGFMPAALAERGGGNPVTPRMAELAAAYRWLDLSAAAEVVDRAAALMAGESALLKEWEAYDCTDPAQKPPARNPFAEVDAAFKAAVKTSPGKRSAWMRAHAEDCLAE